MSKDNSSYKIAHVISGDLWAGAEVQVYNLVAALHAKQIRVQVVLFNEGILSKKLLDLGIDVIVIDENKHGFISLVLQLRNILKESCIDIIHTHGYKEAIVATCANKLTINAVTLRTEHGNPEFYVPWWKPHRYCQHKLNICIAKYINKSVVAVSAQLKAALHTKLGIQHVALIENAIDVEAVEKSASSAAVDYPKHVFKIACVGRLVALKRQDILVKIIDRINEYTKKDCQLYLFGSGPERQNLELLAQALGEVEKIHIKGELQPLYPHLKAMDLLLMPSDHEGLPMTLLESMALKVPVIAHAVGGISQVLQHGKYGTLVDQHDEQGYLTAIVDSLQDVTTMQKVADEAYNYVKANYDIKHKVQEYDELYQTLIK